MRTITLCVVPTEEEYTEETLKKIKNHCEKENLNYKFIEYRGTSPYLYGHFSIEGNTADYEKLCKEFDNIECSLFAELGNVLDCTNEELNNWTNLIKDSESNILERHNISSRFLNLIMPIDSIEILETISNYNITEGLREILESRIKVLKNEPSDLEVWANNIIKGQELLEELENVKCNNNHISNEKIDELIQYIKENINK